MQAVNGLKSESELSTSSGLTGLDRKQYLHNETETKKNYTFY